MDRTEHLEWAKRRAIEYVDLGDEHQAFSSFVSDLQKHPDLKDHVAIRLGMSLLFNGGLSDASAIRKFILGFN